MDKKSAARAPRKGNSSHTTRLARAFQAEAAIKYSTAREIVLRAAREGLLPEPIDVDEMRPALATLRTLHNASDSRPDAATTQPGPVTLSDQARVIGGGVYAPMESSASGKMRAPRCDVCNKVTSENRPYWLVLDSTQASWANQTGIVCGDHLPEHVKTPGFTGQVFHGAEELNAFEPNVLPAETWIACITPQAWQRDYAIEVDAPGETEWDATEFVHANRDYVERLLDTETWGEAVLDVDDVFKHDHSAPEWVAEWSGPFDIHLRREPHNAAVTDSEAADPVAGLEAPPVVEGTDAPGHRRPYVGAGADGARRSAEIDRTELDTLPTGQHDAAWTPATEQRRRELVASIEAWEDQAVDLRVAHEDAEAWVTVWNESTTFPFVEDEDANITGLGHQDRAQFAAAVNAYDEESSGIPNTEDDEWTEDHIGHGWAVLASDGERLLAKVDGEWVTPATPGALPITTLWSRR